MSSITTRQQPHMLGVLVLNHAMQPIWRHGAACDDDLCEAAVKALAAEAKFADTDQTLLEVSLPGGRQYLAAVVQDASSTLMLLRSADDADPLFSFIATVPFAAEIFRYIISNPYQAMTVADSKGKLRFISEVHERFLGLEPGSGAGRNPADIIPNSRLAEVVRSGKAEIAQLQTMHGVTRVVNRLPIHRHGKVIGAIGQVLFKEPEEVFRLHRTVAQQRAKNEPAAQATTGDLLPLIGRSAPMQRLRREIETVAHLDIPVLILGESGTGKELVAQAIHNKAHLEDDSPLISLNLAALPATLLEAELFGYEPGAFTGGSRKGQRGRIEQAEGGTLFLDEVGDIPLEMQVKLLRVLEDRQVQRLGGGTGQRVNFRLITATNRRMQQQIDAERFRLDLYYRISGVVLHIPALRHRREDIPELLNHFVLSFCRRNNMPAPSINNEVVRYLASQDWPGNVRQLRQRIEEALVFCDLRELHVSNFERYSDDDAARPFNSPPQNTQPKHEQDSLNPGSLKDLEYQAVLQAVAQCDGNKKRAAEQLGISRSHLYKILTR